MAKAVYVGVGSKARKMKKAYIGIGGKARKVKKMYIGVGGKARLCYSAELEKVGMATALSTTRYDIGPRPSANTLCLRVDISPSPLLATASAVPWMPTIPPLRRAHRQS